MAKAAKKNRNRERIKRRIRGKVNGTAERPRLSVFRSNKHIYAQLIDDAAGHTIAAASTVEKGLEAEGAPVEIGKRIGQLLAERAKEKGVQAAIFDRNGYRYHGRVQAVAEGAREGGLQF
jgi:large subunit ribosomal protein L18